MNGRNSRANTYEDAETPNEPPPPYTEVASPSEVVTEANFNRPFAALNQTTPSRNSAPGQAPYRPPQAPQMPPQPPQMPPRPPQNRPPSNSSYPGNRQNTYSRQSSGSRPQVPWVYPQGYWCPKCNNTGRKLKNGLSCQDCYGRFAHQNASVYRSYPTYNYPTYNYPAQPNAAPLVLSPGDPRIGGTLCGRCRGRGLLDDLLGEYTCTTCKGIGRLL